MALSRRQRCHDFSFPFEGSPPVHDQDVVNQRDISLLPRDVKSQFFGQVGNHQDGISIEWRSVSQRDGFGWIVATIFPTFECRDQLVEKDFAAIGCNTHRRQYGCRRSQASIVHPLPRVSQIRHSLFGLFTAIRMECALPTSSHSRFCVVFSWHDIGIL